MKLIRTLASRKMKTVQYFNLELIVPEEIAYISVDDIGEIILWLGVHTPYIRTYSWGEDDWVGEVFELDMGQVDLEGMNWRDTLVKYEVESLDLF